MVAVSWNFTSSKLSNRDIIRIHHLLVPFICFVALFICIYMYVLFMTSLGEGVVDIIIKEVVMVSLTLPPMTIDDFFGENIISNLAAFLDVPASKIRIVNVVRETSSRKRNTDTTTIQIEIGRLYLSNKTTYKIRHVIVEVNYLLIGNPPGIPYNPSVKLW